MQTDKLLARLVSVVTELEETCACIRHNTAAAKLNTLLLKRHTEHMHSLLLERGIDSLPAVAEENALLVEQNVILLEEREVMAKQLARLQRSLNAIGVKANGRAGAGVSEQVDEPSLASVGSQPG